jgi:nucleotide-binding universal stress UspA family protein
MPYRKIALATDFSPGSALAFARAKEIALDSQAELILVHILPPFSQPTPQLNDLALGDVPVQVKECVRATARTQLHDLCIAQCRELPADKISARLLEGEPAKTLARIAAAENIDLLVVGSTGLSGLAKAVFGSVAAKIVRKAPCSVLVVRSSREKSADFSREEFAKIENFRE